VSCAYNGENYIIFDMTRENSEQINYSTIESLKNGIVFSGKYESRLKVAHGSTKVLVMINREPDLDKLSRDRWQTMHIEGNSFRVTNRSIKCETRVREEGVRPRKRTYLHDLIPDEVIEIN
jgi:hypothetical protein